MEKTESKRMTYNEVLSAINLIHLKYYGFEDIEVAEDVVQQLISMKKYPEAWEGFSPKDKPGTKRGVHFANAVVSGLNYLSVKHSFRNYSSEHLIDSTLEIIRDFSKDEGNVKRMTKHLLELGEPIHTLFECVFIALWEEAKLNYKKEMSQ